MGLFSFLASFLRNLRAIDVFFLWRSFFSAFESLYLVKLSLSMFFLAWKDGIAYWSLPFFLNMILRDIEDTEELVPKFIDFWNGP